MARMTGLDCEVMFYLIYIYIYIYIYTTTHRRVGGIRKSARNQRRLISRDGGELGGRRIKRRQESIGSFSRHQPRRSKEQKERSAGRSGHKEELYK